MKDDVVLSDDDKFYTLTEITPMYKSRARPDGCDSYLYHKSIKIWQLEDNLYIRITYNEGKRGGWFTCAGEGEAFYKNPHYSRFMHMHELFSTLTEYMSGAEAERLIKISAKEFKGRK